MKKVSVLLFLLLTACQTPRQNAFTATVSPQLSTQNNRSGLSQSMTRSTPESIQKFNRIDANSDHFLSIEELAVVQGSSSTQIVQSLDFDRDNRMSFSEFYVSSYGPGPDNNDIQAPVSFINADQNSDQYLSLDEIAVGSMSKAEVARIIKDIDLDRDQKLSLGEYLNTSWSPGPLYYFRP